MRAGNNRSELGVSAGGARTWEEARRIDMAAMEALPRPLSRMVNDYATKLSVNSVLAYFDSVARQLGDLDAAAEITAKKLRSLEAGELNVFAGKHFAEHGYGLPHAEAKASTQRYGKWEPARRGRARLSRRAAA